MEQPDFSTIKDGDILLSHYIGNWFKYPLDTLITKRICAYTNSNYSHAAVIFREFVGAYCHPELVSGSLKDIEKKMLKQVQHDTGHVQRAPTIHTDNPTGLIVTEAVAKGLIINNFEKYLDEKHYRITIIRIMKTPDLLTQNPLNLILGQGILGQGETDKQRPFPNSLNNTPCPLLNPPPQGGREGWEICEIKLTPQCDTKFISQKSEINLASQKYEALTDEMRAKMKETAFNIINSTKNYYDKKLLILIALAIRLWGKNGYENGMNYLRCHYDNFWICSEWVQYLYAQVGIQFTDTNRLLAPEDFNRYEDKEIVFSNLKSSKF